MKPTTPFHSPLTLHLSERDTICERAGRGVSLGPIYSVPYTAGFSLREWSYRIGQKFASYAHGPENSKQHINLTLTPSLPDGEAKLVVNLREGGFGEVYVGLTPDRWNTTPLADRLELLLNLVLSTFQKLGPWCRLPMSAYEAAVEAVLQERWKVNELFLWCCNETGLECEPELGSLLKMDRWSNLSATERRSCFEAIVETAQRAGYPVELAVGSAFGNVPPPEWVVKDKSTGCEFLLIPGGRFLPGVSEGRWETLTRIYQRLENRDTPLPQNVAPFGGSGVCQLRSTDAVEIGPFLIARAPLSRNVDGVALSPTQSRESDENHADSLASLMLWLSAFDTVSVLRTHHWWLPTSHEIEWVLRCGDERLFPWGVEPTPILKLQYQDAEAMKRAYPDIDFELPDNPNFVGNPFDYFATTHSWGLIEPLGCSTWCAPNNPLVDPLPLVTRGGGADCFPWQGCGEWMLYLTAVESRHPWEVEYYHRSVVRPIIRLV